MGLTENRSGHIVDIISAGFAMTAASWALGYFLRLPAVSAPPELLMAVFIAVLFAGGYALARTSPRGFGGTFAAGALTSALNMLILGSLLSGGVPGAFPASALFWIPGSVALGGLISALGAFFAAAARKSTPAHKPAPFWMSVFAWTLAAETLLLLLAGGVVTSADAGLTVPDWPRSFTYNMFLFPLSRMTGGIYFEHAHRLLGSLVGLTAIVFVICMFAIERRGRLKWLSLLMLLLIVAQGVLGGIRVTSALAPGELLRAPSERIDLVYAIIHGVLGQIIFSIVIAHAVMLSAYFRGMRGAAPESARGDKILGVIFVLLLILQITFGAILRHISGGLHIHITLAVIVLVFGITAGVRAWGAYTAFPRIQKTGTYLMHTFGLQVILGILALVFTGGKAGGPVAEALRVIIPTLHQITGAILLALSVALTIYFGRLAAGVKG